MRSLWQYFGCDGPCGRGGALEGGRPRPDQRTKAVGSTHPIWMGPFQGPTAYMLEGPGGR